MTKVDNSSTTLHKSPDSENISTNVNPISGVLNNNNAPGNRRSGYFIIS